MTAPKTVLVLRTCKADGSSKNGFVWPKSGPVECPDWQPTVECGNGLHGALWGEGDGELLSWQPDAAWLVVKVRAAEIVDLGAKVKFPRGEVVHFGDRLSATTYLATHGGTGRAIIGGIASAGDYGNASAGDYGNASAGIGGNASAGDYGNATTGDYGNASAGIGGNASAGYRGIASAGDYGNATTGNYTGTASAGNFGNAMTGNFGIASAGDYGTVVLRWYDGRRYRLAVGYIGEDGLKPNTPYRCEQGRFVEVTS